MPFRECKSGEFYDGIKIPTISSKERKRRNKRRREIRKQKIGQLK